MMDTSASALQSFAATMAGQYGIDPTIFKWQIGQESGWNPNAHNVDPNTGIPANGIAQFQPTTAAQYGVNTSDPYSSIEGAAKFDSTLLGKNGGDYLGMLKSYGTLNSGVPSSIWDKAKALIAGTNTQTAGSANVGQDCALGDTSCKFDLVGAGLSAFTSNPNMGGGTTQGDGSCSTFDIPCYIEKYGASLLAIIIGLVLIVGGFFLYKE